MVAGEPVAAWSGRCRPGSGEGRPGRVVTASALMAPSADRPAARPMAGRIPAVTLAGLPRCPLLAFTGSARPASRYAADSVNVTFYRILKVQRHFH